jgi:para-nitrobenzyl esterase
MENRPPEDLPGTMNRRTLLGRGAALVAGTAAGLSLPSGTVFGQEKPPAAQPAAKPAAAAAPVNLHPPVVQVNGGRLRGFKDGKILAFLGIRYAEAERFGPPKPVQPWDGIRNAQAWGPVCPVPPMTGVSADEFVFPHRYWVESENCQVLNVWTQHTKPAVKKPVMVWMHGGGFTNGSSIESYAYDGKTLCEFGDVVSVSVNHRLNILGTLDLGAYGPQYANSRYTGTADLVAALQWVHDNIEAFGGDPGNVTIFGQSGGGGKVVRMMHTPAAKGLFHKVVAQSGGSNNYRDTDPAASIKTQQAVAAATIRNLGLTGDQIDKLKAVPYRELLAAGVSAQQAVAKEMGGTGRVSWEVIADDQYVMREFCDWAATIPLMAGAVFSEQSGTLARGDGRKNEWTPQEIDEKLAAELGARKNDIVAEFRKVFPRKKVQDVLYYAGASRPGVKRLLARKLEKGKTPVYNYLFAYEYPVNGGITSFHCAEIAFVFHALGVPQIRIATGGAPAALALQDKVSTAWLNFARSGNPSQPGLEFKPYTPETPNAMVFDAVSQCYPLRDDTLVSLLPAPPRRT